MASTTPQTTTVSSNTIETKHIILQAEIRIFLSTSCGTKAGRKQKSNRSSIFLLGYSFITDIGEFVIKASRRIVRVICFYLYFTGAKKLHSRIYNIVLVLSSILLNLNVTFSLGFLYLPDSATVLRAKTV